jgi:hypothetical protein
MWKVSDLLLWSDDDSENEAFEGAEKSHLACTEKRRPRPMRNEYFGFSASEACEAIIMSQRMAS